MGVDVYQKVTDLIVERMKQGEIPWVKTYKVNGIGCAISHISKEPYSLLNQFLLHEPGEYFTFKQAQKEGLKIKKGAKSKFVVFWKILTYAQAKEQGEFIEEDSINFKTIPCLKYYNVFHESDVEGFQREIKTQEQIDEEAAKNAESLKTPDSIIAGYADTPRGPRISIADKTPSYSPTLDVVSIPQKAQFTSISEYYKTLFHELVHSTGHESRLKRELSGHDMKSYSREELVAEIGASFLASIANLPDQSIDNAVAYLQGWIKPLQSNPRWIVWASSRAEAAVNFILNKSVSRGDAE